ncbi:Hypothetical protein LUCI_3148 [Lucifera butyrica]|uniref:Uncharacterized protein n=1 Tax=Lucifera butyrica TaxID=1351585 RepID=A0A498RCT7_9FIRM|nr:hypothetical protein [Lucifera butyrica]VBB07883.1 Hypothetical protein LUCI_3148 [Lucifera butyrica]
MSRKQVLGYLYALHNYLKTEKTRHDLADYCRALVIMGVVMLVVWRLLLFFVH